MFNKVVGIKADTAMATMLIVTTEIALMMVPFSLIVSFHLFPSKPGNIAGDYLRQILREGLLLLTKLLLHQSFYPLSCLTPGHGLEPDPYLPSLVNLHNT